MRIAALVTQPRGGPVDHAVDVACELAARGHESVLIGPSTHYAERAARRPGCPGTTWPSGPRPICAALARCGGLLRSLRPGRPALPGPAGRAWSAGCSGDASAAKLVYTVHGVADPLSDLVAGNARVTPTTGR